MTNPTNVPYIDDALMAWLEAAFRPIAVDPDTSMNAIQFDAGKQHIIQRVRALHQQQRGERA